MDIKKAEEMARELMAEHELHGWQFKFDNARNRFGQCKYNVYTRNGTISLSKILVELNDEHAVRNTMLHEIAHALVPHDRHGELWKRTAHMIGANPKRCFTADEVIMPPPKYVGTCRTCGRKTYKNSMPRISRSCSKCDTKYNPEHIVIYEKNNYENV